MLLKIVGNLIKMLGGLQLSMSTPPCNVKAHYHRQQPMPLIGANPKKGRWYENRSATRSGSC